jgi:hypothetical protein
MNGNKDGVKSQAKKKRAERVTLLRALTRREPMKLFEVLPPYS